MTETLADAVPATLRRERMRELITSRDFVRVGALSDLFGISEVTVRSDLDVLARRGHIRRVRGGALPAQPSGHEQPFEQVAEAFAEEKAAIGVAAAAMVEPQETIILDVGTTAAAVARALVARDDLHDVVVFTNGLNIALELERAIPRLTVVVTGGTLRPLQHSLVDPLAGEVLDRVNVNTVFLGCNGVHPDAGVTNINLPEAAVKRKMLEAARRRVVVADGSKVGTVALAQLCEASEIDVLLTGASADAETCAAIADLGVEVRSTP